MRHVYHVLVSGFQLQKQVGHWFPWPGLGWPLVALPDLKNWHLGWRVSKIKASQTSQVNSAPREGELLYMDILFCIWQFGRGSLKMGVSAFRRKKQDSPFQPKVEIPFPVVAGKAEDITIEAKHRCRGRCFHRALNFLGSLGKRIFY